MMKKIFKILFILLVISSMMGSSLIKSMFVPGWGEINEYNILKKNNEVENIEYIKDRSNNLLIAEGVIWLGFLLTNDFSKSYKEDYKNYGTLYAGVNWSGKSDLFAAHVGNYNNTEDYNDIVRMLSGSSENTYDTTNPNNLWDWEDNTSLKNKYDNMRNSSEQLDELKTLMIASLAINRIASIFDVIAISRQHGGTFSLDTYDYSNEVGLKFNYNF